MASDAWKGPGKHYVVLLLDGDGYLFINSKVKPKLTVKERVLLQLEKYMNSLNGVDDRKDPRWRCWPEDAFRVRVYLSLRDLRSTIARSRHNLDLVNLDQLMETFRSPGMLWDIIDVGPGEDSADKRIKRDWDVNFNQPKCVHLICGITHDRGYVNMAAKHNLGLEKISKNEKNSRRVTLLTCKATHHRYRGMPFAIVAWPWLFNSQFLAKEPNYTNAFTKEYTGTYQGKSDVETMISEELSRKKLALSGPTCLMTVDIAELARYDELKEKQMCLLGSQTELRLVRRANIALRGQKIRLQEAQETTKALQISQAEELQQALKDNATLRADLEKTQDMVKRLQDLRAKEKQEDPENVTTDNGKASGKRVGIITPTKEALEEYAKQTTAQGRQAVTANPKSYHSRVLNFGEDDNFTNADQGEPGVSAKSAYHIDFQPPNRSRPQLRSSPTTTTVAELKIIIQSIFGSRQQDMQHLQRYYCSSTLLPLCRGEIIQIRRKHIERQAREVLKISMLNRSSTRSRLCSRLSAAGGKFFGCHRRRPTSDVDDG